MIFKQCNLVGCGGKLERGSVESLKNKNEGHTILKIVAWNAIGGAKMQNPLFSYLLSFQSRLVGFFSFAVLIYSG